VTAHKVRRKRLAQGALLSGKNGAQLTRIAVSLPPDYFRRLACLAERRGGPVSAVIRDAVMFYLLRLEDEEAD
jgi:metal-responsive CopG/Arc/MetJ family transcriptional regulator